VLEAGYWGAYRDFYRWGSIFKGAWTKDRFMGKLRHVAYAGGWKKFEPLWDWVIQARRAGNLLPFLEAILAGFGQQPAGLEVKAESRIERVGGANTLPGNKPA
jgi:hypothetical protein